MQIIAGSELLVKSIILFSKLVNILDLQVSYQFVFLVNVTVFIFNPFLYNEIVTNIPNALKL